MHQTREPLQKRFEVQITRRVMNRDTVYRYSISFVRNADQLAMQEGALSVIIDDGRRVCSRIEGIAAIT